jgi:hypothetical protein
MKAASPCAWFISLASGRPPQGYDRLIYEASAPRHIQTKTPGWRECRGFLLAAEVGLLATFAPLARCGFAQLPIALQPGAQEYYRDGP